MCADGSCGDAGARTTTGDAPAAGGSRSLQQTSEGVSARQTTGASVESHGPVENFGPSSRPTNQVESRQPNQHEPGPRAPWRCRRQPSLAFTRCPYCLLYCRARWQSSAREAWPERTPLPPPPAQARRQSRWRHAALPVPVRAAARKSVNGRNQATAMKHQQCVVALGCVCVLRPSFKFRLVSRLVCRGVAQACRPHTRASSTRSQSRLQRSPLLE